MPCGGIFPIKKSGKCWVCDKSGAKHFCEEWDAFIHARCVPKFLQTEEGQIVIDHGHLVSLNFAIEKKPKKDFVPEFQESTGDGQISH